jgi:hypothetical protein
MMNISKAQFRRLCPVGTVTESYHPISGNKYIRECKKQTPKNMISTILEVICGDISDVGETIYGDYNSDIMIYQVDNKNFNFYLKQDGKIPELYLKLTIKDI